MRHLPDQVQTRVNDAIRSGTAHIDLCTRLDTSQTELVLVPTDGAQALWLTQTGFHRGRA